MEKKPEFTGRCESTLNGNLLIDTHCHLDMSVYASDLDQVLERAFSKHLKSIITIGIDLISSKSSIEIARKYKQVSATIGIHPHEVDSLQKEDYLGLEKIYKDHNKHIVGFGEIGLDYYKKHSDPAKQRLHFRRQLDMAHEFNLPVIIHNREADNDILKILGQAKSLDHGGIMHCFSSDYTYACKILDLGMLISIPGIVTFKNSIALQNVARDIPLISMVLETDGPFLAPQPFRGKRNEPSYLIHTAMKISELRQIDVNLVAKQTTANAEKLFFPKKRPQ
ncbi:MAG: TatD family hydrolase [Proteobacteria bacterium]|nr:TatD family hydrolase [Pseudomonadota bacterium]